MQEKFIGIYDNVLTTQECNSVLDYFNLMKKFNLVFDRQSVGDGLAHQKNDETVFLFEPDEMFLDATHPILKLSLDRVWDCYKQYSSKFSVLQKSNKHGILGLRLQKTPIGGGYHDWHYENNGRQNSSRMIAFSIFLNSVPIGGETEFLYLHERVNAVEGRVAIWPAGFTHTHRGNPPISNEKYIITGWLDWLD
jgi:hypothetical protein